MSHGYGDKSYWDKRYEGQQDNYDWYMGWPQVRNQILPHLNVKPSQDEQIGTPTTNNADMQDRKEIKILVVGCGNSELSKNMVDDGFEKTVSIDYSEIVIDKMKKTHGDSLVFEVMDVREMKYADGMFDVIIDKGTLDAILCGADSAKNSTLMLEECQRVMRKGAVFFIITYGQPDSRLNYLQKAKYKWKVTVESLPKTSSSHPRYMYVLRT